MVNNTPANAGASGSIPGQEDPLEKEIATHSSILAWKIPWTEEPGGLYFMGSQRVRHDLATKQQQTEYVGTTLVVQWLGLHASIAGGQGSISG